MKLIVTVSISKGKEPVFVGFDLSRADILKAVAKRRKDREWLKKK